ncbi:uncharacterized protein LACBIDRAFT_300434 [Laccaria bicolor S238N-H82]|uniref:Predicted protein n=1 Tax=Laccaria bicolor (strain S238N-H82 / ATCC MYA-4686) TaxID=486041 RepID=B0DGR7_LACBS|nr:uncharacterized protein LACBIDRAFT_300434 [Laccaria bicolor S238N-H82]EDR06198.1 predicted protein [Laccaria bicolor S238N-H82]|eukprot:XP_001883059.1 predicted protein [Laccaria bicolor S238N-H82]
MLQLMNNNDTQMNNGDARMDKEDGRRHSMALDVPRRHWHYYWRSMSLQQCGHTQQPPPPCLTTPNHRRCGHTMSPAEWMK